MVLWPPVLIPMHSHCWSRGEVACFDVLVPLDADVVQEQERGLTNSSSFVAEMAVIETLDCCRLEGVGHDLSHHDQIELVVAHLCKCAS